MNFFLFSFVSILFAVSLATHVPKHATPPKSGKRTLKSDLKGNVEQFDGGDDGVGDGDDDLGGLGGGGGFGDGGGGFNGDGGDGGDDFGGGGVGAGGFGGFRALRGLSDELVDGNTDLNADDEVVVARGTVVRGGVVVAPPRPRRRWY